jgi:putative endonuclease
MPKFAEAQTPCRRRTDGCKAPIPPVSSAAVASRAFVYLLRCADGSLYCGWSVDLERRIAAHSTGRASRYTASRLPVELAAAWELDSAGAARSLEWRLKQLTRAEKLELVGGAALPGVTRLA